MACESMKNKNLILSKSRWQMSSSFSTMCKRNPSEIKRKCSRFQRDVNHTHHGNAAQ
ncbi:hypothetical protein ENKO_186 [Klebsiella phage fENko-Kae01]|nr:hypothetical protein 7t3_0349 [Salmonella phage 7t3]